MRPAYLLDSNVVVRFLAKDHPEHLEKAKKLMAQAEEGTCELVLAPWIVAEVLYTLISFYGADKKQTCDALLALMMSGGIRTLDEEIVVDALKRFREKNVDFADAMLAAQAVAMKIQPASFDSDLDKFADVKRHRL
jgi:predicted nucleic acid-binding protein